MPRILSVSELTRALADVLESEFPFVWVEGQVTNLARPASGHVYFSLTDGSSLLEAVWFKSSRFAPSGGGEYVNPVTGEVEESEPAPLADGQKVLCAGRINVYAPRGRYQLVAEMVQPQGTGDLLIRFEAMKAKLADKGYFDQDRKLAPPPDPDRVAVVTAPTGAAIRDFLKIADRRGTASQIRIHPVLVQGEAAPGQIARAIDEIESEGWAQVVVLIRGGGSLEDLWAFNTETVADALFNSRTPVICGVGHEVDHTIADMVADKRAATPTHAAMELWPDRQGLWQQLDGREMAMSSAFDGFMSQRESALNQAVRTLVWNSPDRRLERLRHGFARASDRLLAAGNHFLSTRSSSLERTGAALLRAYGPHAVERRVDEFGRRISALLPAMERFVGNRNTAFTALKARLSAMDPEEPLTRGYSLVTVRKTGAFLRGPGDVRDGDGLDIATREGVVAARVEKNNRDDGS